MRLASARFAEVDSRGEEAEQEEDGYAEEEDQGHADAGFAVDFGDQFGGGDVDGDAGGERQAEAD